MSFSSSAQSLRAALHWPTQLRWLQPLVVIFGGFLVQLTLGTLYTFGNMAPYIVAYINNQSHPSNLQFATSSWIYALNLGVNGCTMFMGGILAHKIGPRWTTLIGGIVLSSGVFLSYFAIKISFFLLLLTYGAMFGVGLGLSYIGPVMCAQRWLPKWKGLASGAVVSGFGLGALIFDEVQTSYINPRNIVPEDWEQEGVLERVPRVFLLLGGCYLSLQIIGSLLLFSPPVSEEETVRASRSPSPGLTVTEVNSSRQISLASTNVDSDMTESADNAETSFSTTEPLLTSYDQTATPHEEEEEKERVEGGQGEDPGMVGGSPDPSDDDIQLLLSVEDMNIEEPSTTNSLPSFPASRAKTATNKIKRKRGRGRQTSWTTNVIMSLHPLQMLRKTNFYVLYLMFFFNSIPIVFTATLYKFFALQLITSDDHFLAVVGSVAAIFNFLGRIVWGLVADMVSYKFALVLLSGLMTIALLTFYACTEGGRAMLFVWVCLIFFCIGGNYCLFPTAIAHCFGPKHVGTNFGLLFTSQIASAVLATTLSQVLQNYLTWYAIMFLMSGFSGVGLLLALVYRPKRYIVLSHRQSPQPPT